MAGPREDLQTVVVDNPDLHALLQGLPRGLDEGTIRWALAGEDLGGDPARLRVHDQGNRIVVLRPDGSLSGAVREAVRGATRPVALTVACLAAALLDDPGLAQATLDLDGCHVEALGTPAAVAGA